MFWIWLWFQGFFYESCFFKEFPGIVTWKLTNLWLMIPRKFLLPGIVTQKLENFQVTKPENVSISGYCYPKIALKKHYLYEYLRENQNIVENYWGLNLGPRYYWFMKKTRVKKSHANVPLINQLLVKNRR